MPDQNITDPTLTTTTPVDNTSTPSVTTAVTEELPITMGGLDVPPPSAIVEESPETTTPPPANGIPTNGEKPKKKVSGKLIATILGLLILVGGLGTGLYLVGQQQDIRNRASCELCDAGDTCTYYDCSQKIDCTSATYCDIVNGFCSHDYPSGDPCGRDSGTGTPGPDCTEDGYHCDVDRDCCSRSCTTVGSTKRCGTSSDDGDGGDGGGDCSTTITTFPATSCIADNEATDACNSAGQRCETVYVGELGWAESCCNNQNGAQPACGEASNGYYCTPGGFCIENTTCDYREGVDCVADLSCGGTPTGTGTPPPTETPTVPFCQDISAYDSSWVKLTSDGLKILKPRDKVFLTVKGGNGTFDMARFQINSGAWIESTTLKSGTTNEYYYEYTLDNVTAFTVNAQVHTAAGEWK